MDISLAQEHAYYFVPQISLDEARERVEKKKTSLVAGMFGTLISRPNPAEIQVISVENRLEPYWMVSASSHTAYDRQQVYTIPIKGDEVREVTVLEGIPVTRGWRRCGSSGLLTDRVRCGKGSRKGILKPLPFSKQALIVYSFTSTQPCGGRRRFARPPGG